MAEAIQCTSTKKLVANLRGSVRFPCPSCGKQDIVRSPTCRTLATRYHCNQCGFEGPN